MSRDSLHATLLQLALPAVRAQGLEIWGLELLDGRQLTVRLFVEAAPSPAAPASGDIPEETPEALLPERLSATVDQCEAISRQLSLALDAEDVIDRAYTLEVSTPGFNRIFFSPSQMIPYVGEMIEARMPSPYSPAQGLPARRNWKGRLIGVEQDTFTIAPATVDADGEVADEALAPATIPFGETRRVSRIYIFRRPAKPGKAAKRQKTGKRPE